MAHGNSRERGHKGGIVAAGEAAMVVRLGDAVAPATHKRVLALLRALDASPPPGVVEVVPAYASLLVHFDPVRTTPDSLATAVRATLRSLDVSAPRASRLVRIPVEYGGSNGPDLEEVARLVGLTPDEVVRRHTAADYQVYFLGFLAGFPYLGGLPPELAVPRLAVPRTHVPAGSVGLAGGQTGIYSVASPGGWRLIGRTGMRLFDPAADPPALLRPGDRVSFVAVAAADRAASAAAARPVPLAAEGTDEHAASALPAAPPAEIDSGPVGEQAPRAAPPEVALPAEALPWLRVLRPGPMTTVQDLGRPGYGRYGVSACGAADSDALRLGNLLLGNPAGAAALEVTLGGAAFEVRSSCVIVLTGAGCDARVGSRSLRRGEVVPLAPGEVLELGVAQRGVRVYLCVAGGVAVPPVLGSRSTDVRAGLGGVAGRALRSGDLLPRGASSEVPGALVGRRAPVDPRDDAPDAALRILPGPHVSAAPDSLEALVATSWVVDARSDRVGVRLQPAESASARTAAGGEVLSEGVPHGAIQLPPHGEPIILLADHQATGGYRIPAVVIQADLWRAAQLRPGDQVQLALVTLEEATAARHAHQQRWQRLARALAGLPEPFGTHQGESRGDVSVALLMRGFAEWSEEEDDDDAI